MIASARDRANAWDDEGGWSKLVDRMCEEGPRKKSRRRIRPALSHQLSYERAEELCAEFRERSVDRVETDLFAFSEPALTACYVCSSASYQCAAKGESGTYWHVPRSSEAVLSTLKARPLR